jgi:uncharacterized protein (TIGR02246 family)
MSDPAFDADEKPLDPAAERLERRVRRLILIAGLTLSIGLFAVFGAILYRVMSAGDRPTAVAVSESVDAAAGEAAVRSALAAWNADFNAGNADRICNLFAPDLRYDYLGLPERNFEDMCAQLKRVLADQTKTLAYALDIKEVVMAGDLAVVRLVWTLSARPLEGERVTTQETGMDIFRRQPDGAWKITRFIAYEE